MILYKYGDDKSIVYFWQGSKTSVDEKGASAIHAARIDNEELGGKAVQVSRYHTKNCNLAMLVAGSYGPRKRAKTFHKDVWRINGCL